MNESVSILPEGHLKAVRRVVRLLDKYRSACTVLETYEADFRQFRTVACFKRIEVSEANMRRAWDALEAAIDALRHQPAIRTAENGAEVSNHNGSDI